MALFRNRMLALMVFGLLVVAQSTLWEYVRVQPGWRADRNIISPWSIRGFETTQGRVLLIGAILLGVLGVITVAGVLRATRLQSAIVAGVILLFVIVVPIVTDARPTVLGGIGVILMSLAAATALTVLVSVAVGQRIRRRYRGLVRAATWIGSFPLFFALLAGPLFGGERRPTWLLLGVFFGLIAIIMVVRPPPQIGSYRLMIVAATALLVMAITMATSVRINLLERQFALWEVAADRGEIQITSGMLIAWFGAVIALVGAIGLWAMRRDEITARARARRQQEAARESELELAGVTG